MTVRTAYLKKDHFVEKANFDGSGEKCILNDLVFKKGDTLEKHELKTAITRSKQYNYKKLNTIVVRGKKDITLWIEDKSSTSSQIERELNSPIESNPQPTNQSLPTKTVTEKYRGREYQKVVVDWAAVQQINQLNQQKPRRKYRGQYID